MNWYDNGSVESSGNYRGGVRSGEWKIWFGNKQLKEISNWKDGKKDGILKEWNPDGKLLKSEIYYEGRLVSKSE